MSSDIKKTIVDKKLADYGLQEEKPLVIEDDIQNPYKPIAEFVGGKPKKKSIHPSATHAHYRSEVSNAI